MNVDKPEEYVDMESIGGDGVDSQDKAPGKSSQLTLTNTLC